MLKAMARLMNPPVAAPNGQSIRVKPNEAPRSPASAGQGILAKANKGIFN